MSPEAQAQAQRRVDIARRKLAELDERRARLVRALDEAEAVLEEVSTVLEVVASVDAGDMKGASTALTRLNQRKPKKRKE